MVCVTVVYWCMSSRSVVQSAPNLAGESRPTPLRSGGLEATPRFRFLGGRPRFLRILRGATGMASTLRSGSGGVEPSTSSGCGRRLHSAPCLLQAVHGRSSSHSSNCQYKAPSIYLVVLSVPHPTYLDMSLFTQGTALTRLPVPELPHAGLASQNDCDKELMGIRLATD